MKLKEGMILQEIIGTYVAVPTGSTAKDYHNIVKLNKTGRDVWYGIAEGLDARAIAEKMVETYDGVTLEEAEKTVKNFIDVLTGAGLVTLD